MNPFLLLILALVGAQALKPATLAELRESFRVDYLATVRKLGVLGLYDAPNTPGANARTAAFDAVRNKYLVLGVLPGQLDTWTQQLLRESGQGPRLDDRSATFGAALFGLIRNARATKVAPGELNYRLAKLQKDWLASGNATPAEVQAWTAEKLEYQFRVDADELRAKSAANGWTSQQNRTASLALQDAWVASKLATRAQVERWALTAFGDSD